MPLAVNLQIFYDKLYLYSFDQTNAGFLINIDLPIDGTRL